MKTPESKAAEQLVNLTESHWFNPTVFGRYMAEQPLYTIDRIMEMIVSIIAEQAKVHHTNIARDNTSSEGLLLANELNECIKAYQEDNQITNLKLPSRKAYVKKRERVDISRYYQQAYILEYENAWIDR